MVIMESDKALVQTDLFAEFLLPPPRLLGLLGLLSLFLRPPLLVLFSGPLALDELQDVVDVLP